MTQNNNLSARIEAAISATEEAIEKGDIVALKNCIEQFLKLKVPIDKISESLQDCSLGLLAQAGYLLTIESAALGRNIVLGRDLSLEEVGILISQETPGEALKTILEGRELFGGKLVPSEDTLDLFASG